MTQKNFDNRINELITALKQEIRKNNPIYLMSLLNQKLIHSIQPDNTQSNLPDGFTQKFHYIYGLIISTSFPHKKSIHNKLEKIVNITEDIFQEYLKLWVLPREINDAKEIVEFPESSAAFLSFMSALHQPRLGSSEQFIQFTLDRFKVFDKNFFVPEMGLTTQQILDISLAIIERVSEQYQAKIDNYVEAIQPLYELWGKFKAGEITLEESQKIIKHEPIFKQNQEYLNVQNAYQFINSFVVSLEDFESHFSKSAIEAFFTQFSCNPGNINKNFRYPTDLNELDTKLLIEIDNGKYYVPEVTGLFRKIPTILEAKISAGNQAQSYFKHRDKLTQKSTVELLKKIFTNNIILEEAYYGYKNSQEFETDVLIPYKRTLLICEIKAKALRNPLYTNGNLEKIKSDFKVSVQKAYEQAIRTRNYILSQEAVSFVNKKGHHLYNFQRSDFDDYLLMIVTAESFGSLTTDLSLLLDKDQDTPYPWAISQFDLELLLTRINSPEKLFDYIKQRCQIFGSVFSSDELDFAGYYLRYGNLDFKAQLQKADKMVLDANFCSIFDEDWYEAHGFKLEKRNDELDKPYYSVFERRGNKISMGVEGLPDTFETLQLGNKTSLKKAMPKMTGRNRNMTCPCGSGKKYKNCHGKPEWLL
ncbi:SEC-C domain-containing protein [Anabaena minutissima FACHB-250]|nr:SEC-C domain-containing protein [Anabaena minutissima FACHB-250]